ncbi:conserved hypothetical protein, partial [Ixodes scapularis]
GGPGVIATPPPMPPTVPTTATPVTEKTWWPQPGTKDPVTPSEAPTTQKVCTPEITTSVWVPSPDPGTGTTASSEFKCTQSGTFRHPSNCQKFFDCVHQNEGVMAFEKSCAPGTVFNPANNLCVWPDDVPDCKDH